MSQRTWQQMAEDKVLALGKYGWGDEWDDLPKPHKRADAVESICRSLSDEMYARFKERMQNRIWFTPWVGLGGTVKNLPADRIVYISPVWEAAEPALVEYVVLHEALHVIQDHQLDLNGNDLAERKINDDQEAEVDQLITSMGLQDRRAEAKAFLAETRTKLGI